MSQWSWRHDQCQELPQHVASTPGTGRQVVSGAVGPTEELELPQPIWALKALGRWPQEVWMVLVAHHSNALAHYRPLEQVLQLDQHGWQ